MLVLAVELTVISLRWVLCGGCKSPGEKKQQKQKAQNSPSHIHVCIAAMLEPHAHLRLSNGSYNQSYRAAWHPGWVQAGPRVGPATAHTQVQELYWTHGKQARTRLCFKMACSSVIQNPLCAKLVEIIHSPLRVQFLAFTKAPSWQAPASSSGISHQLPCCDAVCW